MISLWEQSSLCFKPFCEAEQPATQSWLDGSVSVHTGHDSVRHALAVLLPGTAILPETLLLISGLAVHQQCSEVEDVEVGQQVG